MAPASRCGSITLAAATSTAATDASSSHSCAVRPSPGLGAERPACWAMASRAVTSPTADAILSSNRSRSSEDSRSPPAFLSVAGLRRTGWGRLVMGLLFLLRYGHRRRCRRDFRIHHPGQLFEPGDGLVQEVRTGGIFFIHLIVDTADGLDRLFEPRGDELGCVLRNGQAHRVLFQPGAG